MSEQTQISEPATTNKEWKETEVGSVFVSNYPPYSFWKDENISQIEEMLQTADLSASETPLAPSLRVNSVLNPESR